MSQRDPNTIDLTQQKLRIADDVRVWPVQERGKLVYRLEIPSQHKFFRVGYEEYVFISMLDGKTTVPQACGLAASVLGSRAPSSTQAESIQRWLLKNELAFMESDVTPARSKSATPAGEQKIWSRLNPFWIKVPVPNGHALIGRMADKLTWLMSPLSVVFGCLMIAIGGVFLAVHWRGFTQSAAEVFSVDNWIWLLGTWMALKIIHELGHAIACHRQNCTVRETGLVLILFAPLAYVDVTSCWRLNSRLRRIVVAAAGMYVELTIAAIAIMLWAWIDSPKAEFLLHNLVISAGLSTVLFNANALMRFDGYFILADLVDIPNLYGEGSAAVRRIGKRVVFGMSGTPSSISGWRRYFVAIYGIAATIWKSVICVSLAIAASTMFAGAGILIAALGCVLWFGNPIKQFWKFTRQVHRQDAARWTRGMVSSAAIALTVWGIVWWLPIPTAVNVPAVTAYLPETLVRSGADGFIGKVHVQNSQLVRTGDVLLEIENRELKNRLRRIELSMEQNAIRMRQAADDHDASQVLVLRESSRALNEQHAHLRRQVAGLVVYAPQDGRVIDREIHLKQGVYVREGDPLLWVADRSDKEVIAVIDQDSIKTVRRAEGESVWVRTAEFAFLPGQLRRIRPRANDRLPSESLAATEGGPLPVRPRDVSDDEDDQPYRLLTPHFEARIQLSEEVAAEISAGMRVEASFGYRCDPLASRVRTAVRKMWNTAQAQTR